MEDLNISNTSLGVSPENAPTDIPPKSKGKGMVLAVGAVILILILGGVAFWAGIFKPSAQSDGSVSKSSTLAPSSNNFSAKGARVNGEEISAAQVDDRAKVILADIQAQGVQIGAEQENFAKQQALQQLINEALLLQAAAKANIAVSDEQVENQFKSVAKSFATPEEFDQALAKNNTTADQLKADIKRQFTIQAYLDSQIDQNTITASDKEIEDLYNQYAVNTPEMPPFDSVKPQLEQQLRQQKFNQQVKQLLQKLASEAQIEIL